MEFERSQWSSGACVCQLHKGTLINPKLETFELWDETLQAPTVRPSGALAGKCVFHARAGSLQSMPAQAGDGQPFADAEPCPVPLKT